MNEIIILIITHIFVGVIFTILGVPLYLEKIKPNKLYGFRLEKTLSNKKIWYKANKFVGKDLINSGILIVIISLLILTVNQKIPFIYIALIELLIVIIPVIIIITRGMNYLNKL